MINLIFTENVSSYFLKDLYSGMKDFVDVDDAKTVNAPQYESLTVAQILDFTMSYPRVERYLPDEIDLPKVPRGWLINVCAAVIGRPFKNWVYDKIEERNVDMINKNDDNIAVCKKVADRLEGCTQVSSKFTLCNSFLMVLFVLEGRGTGLNMMKPGSKRRRTVKQIKAEKAGKAEKEKIISEKLAMFDQM